MGDGVESTDKHSHLFAEEFALHTFHVYRRITGSVRHHKQ